MFDGKMSVFREEGGVVKTEEEKQKMAEKRRFKQNREFKKRLDEQEENAEADIRTFKFRSLEKKESKKPYEARESREDRRSRDFRKSKDSRDFRGPKSNREFKKPFKKDNRRFHDDED
jgi:putative N6-adenine-specific DNA methylase